MKLRRMNQRAKLRWRLGGLPSKVVEMIGNQHPVYTQVSLDMSLIMSGVWDLLQSAMRSRAINVVPAGVIRAVLFT